MNKNILQAVAGATDRWGHGYLGSFDGRAVAALMAKGYIERTGNNHRITEAGRLALIEGRGQE